MGGLMKTMSHIWTRFILHWKVCFLCNSWALALLKNCFCYLNHHVLKVNAVNPPTTLHSTFVSFVSHLRLLPIEICWITFGIAADIWNPLTLWLSIEMRILFASKFNQVSVLNSLNSELLVSFLLTLNLLLCEVNIKDLF